MTVCLSPTRAIDVTAKAHVNVSFRESPHLQTTHLVPSMRLQPVSRAVPLLRRAQCRRPITSAFAAPASCRGFTETTPVDGYAEDLLNAPLHRVQPGTQTAPAPPPADELPKTEKEEAISKARVVFGSRLAGPVERRDQIRKASTTVAGILVPPKPDEPDNCCMSGCVNCVWDVYRDELEEWAAASAEARQKLIRQRVQGQATGMMAQEGGMPSHVATSMDDDGGGSETNWEGMESFGDGNADLFQGIPVGIREFMKTEKKLKQQHLHQGSSGG